MKNIFKIFKKDVVKICTNWVALIVVTGLIILPSLYAWFNIKSSWDPYGNTKGIKIAIVNDDKGAEFNNKKINVGDELVDELKKNDSLGWQFVNDEQAKVMVERGEVFASIVIPNDFSKDAISLTTKNIQKPQLIYTVNEGANAIAPKITDKGVETLKQNVDSNLVKTVNGIIFKIFNEAGIEYENERPKIKEAVSVLYDLNNNSDKIGNLINEAYNGSITINEMVDKINAIVPSFEKTIDNANNILNTGEQFLNSSKDAVNKVAPMIKDDLALSKKIIDSSLEIMNSINSNVDKNTLIETLNKIKGKLQTAEGINNSILKMLNSINKDGNLDNAIARLNNVNEKINTAISVINKNLDVLNGNGTITEADIQGIKEKLQNVSNGIGEVLNNYDSQILPGINKSIDALITFANNGEETIQKTKDALPKVKEGLAVFKKGVKISTEQLKKLKDNYPEIQKTLADLVAKIKKVDNGDNVDKILDLLTNDWQGESDFLGNPVTIHENRLYQVPNYGSAMSPFYTTLALWVGGLILVSILSVSTRGIDKEKEDIKSYQVFFGKYLTFLSIGILQGLVVTMGDMFILKTYVLNKVGFVFFGIFISIIFISIIYSTVSVLGNIGKAVCIIFLVLQVAASGGTFPVEVMSSFFKFINPMLPFKYAIDGMRYLVAGGVKELFITDIRNLIFVGVGFVIIGVLIKKPLNKGAEGFIKKLDESEIVGH